MSGVTRLLFFGALRDAAGGSTRDATLPRGVDTIGSLRSWLGAEDPLLAAALAAPGVLFAVDQKMASEDASVVGAGEVAFMSPMSGG